MPDAQQDFGLIALAPNDWHGQWVNRQQLLSRLGGHLPVVYSTGGYFVWDRRRDAWRKAPLRGRFERNDSVWVDHPSRWLMRWPRVAGWDNRILARQAQRWRRKLAASGARRICAYVFHPAFLPYVRHLGAERIVYHAYDLFSHQPDWNEQLAAAEDALLETADLVIVPSDALAEELNAKCARPIRVLLNAADVPSFVAAAANGAPEPKDLEAIPRPRVGYLGSLHPQIDYRLLRALAERRPGHQWVLVGPRQREVDLLQDADFVACTTLSNVHMLGAKDKSEIAAYTAAMDVNVMIYRSTSGSWTKVAYPLKVHEYLGAGRPVVSMDLPMLRPLEKVIRFASDVDDWLTALDDAIAGRGTGSKETRQASARGHDWESRAKLLDQWLVELMDGEIPRTFIQPEST